MENFKLEHSAYSAIDAIHSLKGEIEDLEGRIGQLQEENDEHKDRIRELEEEVADLKTQLKENPNY